MSAYNGSGTFVISGTGLPYVTNTTISSTVGNQLNTDLATGLSTAITKDGQTVITNNIPMAGFKLTGLGGPTTTGDALSYGNAIIKTGIGTDAAIVIGEIPQGSSGGICLNGHSGIANCGRWGIDVTGSSLSDAPFAINAVSDTNTLVSNAMTLSRDHSTGKMRQASFLPGLAFNILDNTNANPIFKVDTSAASVATGISVTGAAAASGAAIAVLSTGTNENLTIDAKGSGTITFGASSTGNVVVSRTMTAAAANFSGSISSTVEGTVAAAFTNNETSSHFTVQVINLASGTVNLLGFYAGSGATNTGVISSNGTTTTYGTTCDYRVKDIAGAFSGAGAIVDALPIHLGNYKSVTEQQPLFLAHELQEAGAGFAVIGNKDGKNMQQIDTAMLLPLIWAALKETRADIAAMRATQ